jgi:hypothetical protein
MSNDKQKRGGVLLRGLLIAAFLAFLAVPGYTQFAIEGDLGLNLFSIASPTMETTWYLGGTVKAGDIEIDLSIPTMLAFGAYGGYGFGNMEVGAEFAFFKGSGDSKDVKVDGVVQPDTAGDFDIQYIRIGPVLRYYIQTANAKLVPLVGAAVDYIAAKVDIDEPSVQFNQGYLDIGAFGGVLYFIQPKLYVGGVVRFDYFLTIVKDEITVDMSGVGGTTSDKLKDITSSGWMPASIYAYIGYRF